MKRLISILSAALFLLNFTGCALENKITPGNTTVYTDEKPEEYGSFTSKTTYSFDKKYYAVQSLENNDSASRMNGIVITIYDSDSHEEVFSFTPARAYDFWGICWEKDSYNIWLQSGDIGVFCYRFDNDKWLLDEHAEKPDYIISTAV